MTKPVALPEWDKTELNTIDPGITRKDSGWQAPGGIPEKPPFQVFNHWQNNVYKWIKHVNDVGVLGWDNSTIYDVNSYVVGSDGNLYKSLTSVNQNNDPIGDIINWAEVIQDIGIINVKTFGAKGDGATDDTTAIQAAIDFVGTTGGVVYFPAGVYKTTASLIITNISNIAFVGDGMGSGAITPGKDSASRVEFDALSTPVAMLKLGGFGDGAKYCQNVGFSQLEIDCNQVATIGLHVKDAALPFFDRFSIKHPTEKGLYLTNTPDESISPASASVTGFVNAKNLHINCGDIDSTAHCIYIETDQGIAEGSEGVTHSNWSDCALNHWAGHGVYFANDSDQNRFERCFIWRVSQATYPTATGYGVFYADTDTANNKGRYGHDLFHGCTIKGGIRRNGLAAPHGISINDIASYDLDTDGAAGAESALPISGIGIMGINGTDDIGRRYGLSRLNTDRQSNNADSMRLIRYDSTNGILHTYKNNWVVDSLASGTINNTTRIQGATQVYSGVGATDFLSISDAQNPYLSYSGSNTFPLMLSELALNTNLTTGSVGNWGMMGDRTTIRPSDGVWVESDISTYPNFQFITSKASVLTRVDTGIPVDAAQRIWLIVLVSSSQVVLYSRPVQSATGREWDFVCGSTTNIPLNTSLLLSRYAVFSDNVTAASLEVYRHELVHGEL